LLCWVFKVKILATFTEIGICLDSEDQVFKSEEVKISLAGLAFDSLFLREVIHEFGVQIQLRERGRKLYNQVAKRLYFFFIF
jgi:hypothetical protein